MDQEGAEQEGAEEERLLAGAEEREEGAEREGRRSTPSMTVWRICSRMISTKSLPPLAEEVVVEVVVVVVVVAMVG
jgi:hypothetical protein